MKSVLFAAAAVVSLSVASAGHAEVVLNTSLGTVAAPGTTTTDATGTRSTNAAAAPRVSEAFSFNDWQQRNVGGGGTVGITSDYARSGNGSVFFGGINGNSKADLEYFFSAPVALSSFNGASYDWYRDSSSTNNGIQGPSLRLYVNNGAGVGGTLIFEPYYQGAPANLATDTWVNSTFDFNSTVWARPAPLTPPAGSSCDPSACFNTLSAFAASNPNLFVTGVSTGIGSGWFGAFEGGVDNINFSFGGNQQSFNFEVAGGAVPEPATWAMMLIGFGGLGSLLRANRRRAAAATA